jgi:hypothetical protein
VAYPIVVKKAGDENEVGFSIKIVVYEEDLIA